MKKDDRTYNIEEIKTGNGLVPEQPAEYRSNMLRKSGIRIAGAVLTGTLVIGTGLPVFAETAQNSEEKVLQKESEQEKAAAVIFLNTESGSDSSSGLSADQAVQTADKAEELLKDLALKNVKLTSDLAEDTKSSDDSAEEETQASDLILVLCDSSELTEEQTDRICDTGASVMTEDDYREYLEKIKEKDSASEENSASDDAGPAEILTPETESEGDEDSLFIWNQPQVVLPSESVGDTGSADTGAETVTETSGILLPGFSVEISDQTETEADESVQDAVSSDESDPSAQNDVSPEAVLQQTDNDESEELIEEEPVYTLFAAFALSDDEIAAETEVETAAGAEIETAAADETNQLLADETTVEEEDPVMLALPGRDLVGKGTSSVGSSSSVSGSTSSSGSTSASTGSSGGSSSASASSGSTSSASGSTGSTSSSGASASSGNASSGSTASAASGSTSTGSTASSGTQIIATGDASNRTVWGLTAGISAAMAAFLAALWKKFGKIS